MAELATVVDPDQVPAAVAAALGALLGASTASASSWPSYWSGRRTLIVLDNCEHVIEAAAALAEMLLRRADGRGRAGHQPGAARGPRRDGLADPTARRGRRPRPRCATGPEPPSRASRRCPADAPALERICARLDGLPLAIELAAARLHMLSAAEIAARLDDRFRLLTGGARTAVDRHRTLRATIDWSYDLLDADSQTLLRRLSVFAGGFDLAAAEAVGGPDALDLLSGLVDRSWVAVEPPGGRHLPATGSSRRSASTPPRSWPRPVRRPTARQAHCDHFRQRFPRETSLHS